MPLGIDPKVDFAFKLVFGSPDHTRVTIHFLNAVLELPRPIASVEILNPIQGKDYAEDKLAVLDVLAADAEGRRFNVEMQSTLPFDLPKRLTYYNCLNYIRQLRAGDPYYQLRPAISICVLDRVLFAAAEDYHLSFRLRCDQQPLVFNEDLQFHILELPKYHPPRDNREAVRALPPLEKWLYFLKHAEGFDAGELAEQLVDEEFSEATGVLEMILQSPEDPHFNDAHMKFLHDQQARLIAAYEEGRKEGRQEVWEQRVLAGKIQMLQQLLGEQESSLEELLNLDRQTLDDLFTKLLNRYRSRGT